MRLIVIFTSLFLFIGLKSFSQKEYEPSWESVESRPIPSWFEDAKFGIFIHWGVFSVPAWAPTEGNVHMKYAEWYWKRQNPDGKYIQSFADFHNEMYGEKIQYQDFANDFKAEMFNPDQWAEIIKNSGAKYVVLTSKHHDGFALWPSAQSWNWNSVDTGPHRDLCKELTYSVKATGIHMGLYYSLYEWYNPVYQTNVEKYVDDHMIPQLKDLVIRYEPDIIWADGEWDHPSETWKSTEFLAWLYNESPVKETVVVNDRWGKGIRGNHGGFFTTEYDLIQGNDTKGTDFKRPWEECRGIGGSFGYNRNEILKDYETSESLINMLINKVARGGNLLLNIGPTADGRIPVIMQQRLHDIGEWLKVNGEAIYGTRKWDDAPEIQEGSNIFFTAKNKDLYMIITQWQDFPFTVNGVGKAEGVMLLGCPKEVNYTKAGNKLVITPPSISPANVPCQYAWVFKLVNAL